MMYQHAVRGVCDYCVRQKWGRGRLGVCLSQTSDRCKVFASQYKYCHGVLVTSYGITYDNS